MSPGEFYDEATGEYYEIVDDPEADFNAQLQARAAEYEAWLDRVDAVVEVAERNKGRSFTEKEVNIFLSRYLGGGIDEQGIGDIDAAVEAVHSFGDLDDKNERRAWLSERLQEEDRAEGVDPSYSSLDEIPEPVQAEDGGDYEEGDE